jgi:hypothetical protein
MAAQRPPTGGCQGSGAARVDFLSACRGAGVYRRPVKGARRPGTRRLRPTTPTPAPVDLCALARAGLWTRSARAPAGPPDLRPGGGAARSSPETPRARHPPQGGERAASEGRSAGLGRSRRTSLRRLGGSVDRRDPKNVGAAGIRPGRCRGAQGAGAERPSGSVLPRGRQATLAPHCRAKPSGLQRCGRSGGGAPDRPGEPVR